MKKSFLFSALLALTVTLTSCNNDDVAPEANAPFSQISLSRGSADALQAYNDFAFGIYNKIAASNVTNEVFSPLSAAVNLSMMANGADGDSRAQILNVLYPKANIDDLNSLNRELLPVLGSIDPKCSVIVANGFWYDPVINAKDAFTALMSSNYMSHIGSADAAQIKSDINDWVKTATNGKISDIVDPSDHGLFYFVNALYFNGKWAKAFNVNDTHNGKFTTAEGKEVTVPMMSKTANQGCYGYNDVCAYTAIPYGTTNYEMVIVLPDEGKTVADVKAWLATTSPAEMFDEQHYSMYCTDIVMPRFTIEQKKYDMIPALQSLGITDIFDSTKANLLGISNTSGLSVGASRQLATIEVDEDGTTATAASSTSGWPTSAGPVSRFVCDRPFMFMVRERSTGAVLFIGQVADPS